jgi:hypothetical protein
MRSMDGFRESALLDSLKKQPAFALDLVLLRVSVVKTVFDLGLSNMTIKSKARPGSPRRHGGHGEGQNSKSNYFSRLHKAPVKLKGVNMRSMDGFRESVFLDSLKRNTRPCPGPPPCLPDCTGLCI